MGGCLAAGLCYPTIREQALIGARRLVEELRRRGVYRVAVGYAVAALALIEAADLVLPIGSGGELERLAPVFATPADRDVIGAITDHLYEGLL